jgi:putative ABC transport system ATP-binding protein
MTSALIQKPSYAVQLKDLSFGYDPKILVLDIDELTVVKGDRVFVHGPSGCGKSTLLGIIGGLFLPKAKQLKILDRDLMKLGQSERDQFRGQNVGFIFQMFNLLPFLTVIDNVMLAARLHPPEQVSFDSLRTRAVELLERMGLGSHIQKPVTSLSTGQQQRVAAVRALLKSPSLVIADEPTSSLDYDARERFLELLFEMCDRINSTLVFVSHDHSLKKNFRSFLDLPKINRSFHGNVTEVRS